MGLLCVFDFYYIFLDIGKNKRNKRTTKVQQGRRTNIESEIEWTKQLETLPLKRQCKKAVETCFALFSIAKNGISQKGTETTEAKTDKKNLFV